MDIKELVREKVLAEMVADYAAIILDMQKVINEGQQKIAELTKAVEPPVAPE